MGAPFSKDFVEAVRDAGDIVRLISEYVPLKQSGRRLKGLCPFHQEKTPSFFVNPEQQLFFCFGCQTGGDVFKFVMLYEKVGFREAAEMLARRWRVPLPAARTPADDARARVLEMNQIAEAFFRGRLADTGAGARCRRYLEQRGLGEETISKLGLGYAPDSWEALDSQLASRRFKPQERVAAGLAVSRREGPGQYDRFRDRLVFPIRDVSGRTVAFGGRALKDDAVPKYLNSPETLAYTKGDHLYGLELGREAIRREGFAIVVEGYTDLAALREAGFHNVVAPLGTAFTPAQARLLARYAERVVLSFDGDTAGDAATTRSVDLLLERGFQVRVVDLPGDQDPDDYIQAQDREAYGKLVRQAPDYLEFLVRRETARRDLGRVEEQVAAVNAVLPHVARLGSSIERAGWAGRLADALNIDDALVQQELRHALRSARGQIRQQPGGGPRPVPPAEARLVNLLIRSADARAETNQTMDPGDLDMTRAGGIVRTILHLDEQGHAVDVPAVLHALENESDRDLLTRIAFHDEPEDGPGIGDCLRTLKRRRLAREGRDVARQIARLQQGTGLAADPAEVNDQLQRLQELARQRDSLS